MSKVEGCWAQRLDDCSGVISGEHRISVAAWPDGKDRDEKKRKIIDLGRGVLGRDGRIDTTVPGGFLRSGISVNRITVDVLCQGHNHAVRDTDSEAGRFSTALRDFWGWKEKRTVPGLPYAPKAFEVNGPVIERWFIKTAIANAIEQGLPIGSHEAKPGMPSDELVDVAFGRRRPPGVMGLSGAFRVKEGMGEQDEFQIGPFVHYRDPVHDGAEWILGAFGRYRGLRTYVNLSSKVLPPVAFLHAQYGWSGTKMLRPFTGISDQESQLRLRFRWP